MPRINAEKIDFDAYFHSCHASEPVSQHWKPFHRLPRNSGSGCYMLLADFSAAKKNQEPPLSGMYAFYFGRSDTSISEEGTKSEGLTNRGKSYFLNDTQSMKRPPNQLRKALMDEAGVPTILMCSQIPVSEGKGVLEAMMLQNYDFFTNSAYNGGARGEGSAILATFRQACTEVKTQKPIQHQRFFASVQRKQTDSALRNAFLMRSRSVSVRIQEAYTAMDAAESSSDQSHQWTGILKQRRTKLQGLLCDMLHQLEEAGAIVDSCAATLQESVDPCFDYYSDVPPITKPTRKGALRTFAWTAARDAELAQKAAWDAVKAAEPAQTSSAEATVQSSSAKLLSLGISVVRSQSEAQKQGAGSHASSSMRQTRRMTAAQSQSEVQAPVPKVYSSLFDQLCDELQVQKVQRRNFKCMVRTAKRKDNISLLERYMQNLRLLRLAKAKHIVEDLVHGNPLHPKTNLPCKRADDFRHIIALFLAQEADEFEDSDSDHDDAKESEASVVDLSAFLDDSTEESLRFSESLDSEK